MYGIDQICINIATQIASHPLILANLIINPLTKLAVPITNYRLYGGIETSSNILTCAVYPAPITSLTAKSADSQTATVIYQPYNLGVKQDEVMSMIHISFYYNSVTAGSQSTPLLIENVPTQLPINNDEIVIESTRTLELYTDASLHILSQCIELLRLIIYDIQIDNLNTKVEVLRSSFIGGEWETNPYFKEVVTACLVTTYPPKAAKLSTKIKNIQYKINENT
jgi:hypothetical protein